MASEFKIVRRVEFSDTDMAGIMHFSNFFRYMETAEHAFFRSLGLSIHTRIGDQLISWPRVHVECKYLRPLRFEDEVEVHLILREKRNRSLVYNFIFRKLGLSTSEIVAQGAMTTICAVCEPASGQMSAVPIPDEIGSLLEVAPPEMLEEREISL